MAVVRLCVSLCRDEASLTEWGCSNASAIGQADPHTQQAIRAVFVEARDEIRAERAKS